MKPNNVKVGQRWVVVKSDSDEIKVGFWFEVKEVNDLEFTVYWPHAGRDTIYRKSFVFQCDYRLDETSFVESILKNYCDS